MDEMDGVSREAPSMAVAPPQRISRGADWLREAWRVLCFRAPRWERLDGQPLTVLRLVLAGYLLDLAVQRALMDGPATLNWGGFLNGWAAMAISVWLCWVVARSCERPGSPTTGTLVSLHSAAGLVLVLIVGIVMVLLRAGLGQTSEWPIAWQWVAWLIPLAWIGLAGIRVLLRIAASPLARLAVVLLTPAALLVGNWLQPAVLWWPAASGDEPKYTGLLLNEEVLAAQGRLLAESLDALSPPQAGRINVYAATYAPYASQDVFMRESAVVAKTMGERFGAAGRTVQLVMNPATETTLPWATQAKLHQTILRMAAVMDRDRDVLFLHLTSHGGADGRLATDSWPLQTEPLTPDILKRWLDEAGIRWRVVSISACYSGSWIAPLSGDGTLVMTAADATHTSYGCGSRSPLTFFGQAMYVDALHDTWSFAEAHARARQLIETREKAAGKSDGYSNPQISEGAGIRQVLQRLAAQQRGS